MRLGACSKSTAPPVLIGAALIAADFSLANGLLLSCHQRSV